MTLRAIGSPGEPRVAPAGFAVLGIVKRNWTEVLMEFCFSELPVDGTDWIERTSLTLTPSFSFLPSAVSFVHHQKRLHFTMSKGLFPKRLLAARHQLRISVREFCPAGSPAACALRNKLWIERGLSTCWSRGRWFPSLLLTVGRVCLVPTQQPTWFLPRAPSGGWAGLWDRWAVMAQFPGAGD